VTKNPISTLLVAILLLITASVFAQQNKSDMIAVATSDKTAAAAVSGQTGRSPFFLLFDKQGHLVEAVSNPYKNSPNAGIPTLDFLVGKGVSIVVAEGFGPKIVDVMKSKGMRPVEFKGNAQDAVKKALES
jgi:predicted Fe-Mo cluster-binding NifX family protein